MPQEIMVPAPTGPQIAHSELVHPEESPVPGSPVPPRKPVDLKTGGAEVVVIIRDPAHPEKQNRVVIIHDASSKFMSYLDGELEGAQNGLAMQPRQSPIRPVGRQLRVQNVPRTELASQQQSSTNRLDRHKSLQQTSLSTPVVPRRYVRSTGSSLVK